MKSKFKEERITVVQNSIDTKLLSNHYDTITDEGAIALKEKLGIKANEHTLIYCGALVKQKKIDFLIDAVDKLQEKNYKFKFIVIGSGPLESFVTTAAKDRPWLIFVWAKFEREKSLYFRIADIFLHPGAMGLAILDSFAFETPLVTSKDDFHGPEIEYIVDGYNGIITENDLNDYVNMIGGLLDEPIKLESIKKNCRLMVNKYNMENMVNNFAEGIKLALN